jgi:agmatine deiminase
MDKTTTLRWPAEWEPQEAIWFTWPQNAETWTPVWESAKATYRKMIATALEYQNVVVLAAESGVKESLEKEIASLDKTHRLMVLPIPTNDSWIRDYGALAVEVREPSGLLSKAFMDFRFNSWGGKYPPWNADDAVGQAMATHRSLPYLRQELILEGGSIDANGQGLLLTTRQCLLNPNRNPHLNQAGIEKILGENLGVEEILWLESGIDGDDTDGHIDDLARFTDARTVFCGVEESSTDENFAALRANVGALNTYAKKLDLAVVEIPMPDPVVTAGLRTPATYLNFLILNDAVLVPIFKDKRDDTVLDLFVKHFPGRAIRPIDCRSLVFGQGALHCSSMQEAKITTHSQKV